MWMLVLWIDWYMKYIAYMVNQMSKSVQGDDQCHSN